MLQLRSEDTPREFAVVYDVTRDQAVPVGWNQSSWLFPPSRGPGVNPPADARKPSRVAIAPWRLPLLYTSDGEPVGQTQVVLRVNNMYFALERGANGIVSAGIFPGADFTPDATDTRVELYDRTGKKCQLCTGRSVGSLEVNGGSTPAGHALFIPRDDQAPWLPGELVVDSTDTTRTITATTPTGYILDGYPMAGYEYHAAVTVVYPEGNLRFQLTYRYDPARAG